MDRRRFIKNLAIGSISVPFIYSISSGLSFLLNSKEDLITKAKNLLYSQVPSSLFKFEGVGKWSGYSPNPKEIKQIVTHVHNTDYPMNYFEYVQYAKKWINWEVLDKQIVNDLKSGRIQKLSFEFKNTKAVSRIYYSELDAHLINQSSYFKDPHNTYSGSVTIERV